MGIHCGSNVFGVSKDFSFSWRMYYGSCFRWSIIFRRYYMLWETSIFEGVGITQEIPSLITCSLKKKSNENYKKRFLWFTLFLTEVQKSFNLTLVSFNLLSLIKCIFYPLWCIFIIFIIKWVYLHPTLSKNIYYHIILIHHTTSTMNIIVTAAHLLHCEQSTTPPHSHIYNP